MKKIALFVASIILIGGIANASEIIKNSTKNSSFDAYYEVEPIEFMERGIVFYVFPDGQFDFNTVSSSSTVLYRPSKRIKTGNPSFTPEGFRKINQGVRVDFDTFGRIRRIGSVFLNYDAANRIQRIGSVHMKYNRMALIQVGGLQLIYNHRGQIVNYVGFVKGYSNGNNHSYCYSYPTNSNYVYQNSAYYYKNNNSDVKTPIRGRRN